MLTYTHELSYRFFDVGGGDAIWIRFFGNDGAWHNILMDGGYGRFYKYTFGPLISQILSGGERIDLWIITHIDRDHIGAVLGFVRDTKIKDKRAAVSEFWLNHPEFLINEASGKLAVSDGIKFKNYLDNYGWSAETQVTTSIGPVDRFGLSLNVLSPTPEKKQIVDDLWLTEVRVGKLGRELSESDHRETIESLKLYPFNSDSDIVNGSSISLLITYRHINVILLADSHPVDVVASLTKMGYSQSRPLKAAFMQLGHHGSKGNTSPLLLSVIQTGDYVITGNGIHNRHPDKATLVRVLCHENRRKELIRMHFVCDTIELHSIFSTDQDPYERYNFTCGYGGRGRGSGFCYFPLNDNV